MFILLYIIILSLCLVYECLGKASSYANGNTDCQQRDTDYRKTEHRAALSEVINAAFIIIVAIIFNLIKFQDNRYISWKRSSSSSSYILENVTVQVIYRQH